MTDFALIAIALRSVNEAVARIECLSDASLTFRTYNLKKPYPKTGISTPFDRVTASMRSISYFLPRFHGTRSMYLEC